MAKARSTIAPTARATGDPSDAASRPTRAELRQEVRAAAAEARQQARVAKAKERAKTKASQGPFLEQTHLGRTEHEGPMRMADILLALGVGAGSGLWTATRPHTGGDDIFWALGSTIIGGIVAMEAREGSEVEYAAMAIASVNASYALLRFTGGITQGG